MGQPVLLISWKMDDSPWNDLPYRGITFHIWGMSNFLNFVFFTRLVPWTLSYSKDLSCKKSRKSLEPFLRKTDYQLLSNQLPGWFYGTSFDKVAGPTERWGVGVPETAYRILEWRKTKCQAKKGQKTHIEFTNGHNLKIQESFETANHK